MTNKAIARILKETGTLVELSGGNAFRARAFQRAARRIDGLDEPVTRLADEGRLTDVDGIGKGLRDQIEEILQGGTFDLREELLAGLPDGLPDVLRVKGLGTKRVRQIWQELGVTSLDQLEEAARSGQLATLDGFGKKTQEKVLTNVRQLRRYMKSRHYRDAFQASEELLASLRQHDAVARAETTGRLRRKWETIDRVVLLVASDRPGAVATALGVEAGTPEGDQVLIETTMPDGLPLEVRVVAPERFGTALWYATGSSDHCAAVTDRAGAPELHETEEALYEAAGLRFVPPELREGTGEVEAAATDALPTLIRDEDLQGTLHNHSTYSDGAHTLEEMAEAARERDLSYFGICDHSQTLTIANGLSAERVREQQAEIEELNANYDPDTFQIFSGIESDILSDGSLDYPEEVLESFDFVVASVHSGFNMSEEEATERIVTAIANPYTTILGHPTGRLLLRREGYPVDHERIIAACAEHDVAIELNANPYRLDMDWRFVRQAVEAGVMISINPDAHSTSELDNTRWGVAVARKGWLTADRCLNALSLADFRAWLGSRQPASSHA